MTEAMHIKYLAQSQLLLASAIIILENNRSRDWRASQWIRTLPALPDGTSAVVKHWPSTIKDLGLILSIATINEKMKPIF